MNIKKALLLALLFFFVCLLNPKPSKAIDLREVLTSESSIIVKIQEGVEYFFAFKVENKVQVLEKHAEKRLSMAKEYAEQENNEKVQNVMQSYLQIKGRQNDLLEKDDTEGVLESVEERTIEQQKTMEEIKSKIEGETKQNIIQVQEQVVNQVAKRIVEVNGSEGQTEFFNKVEHVWAPGTGSGGGEAGVVVVGGTMQFAPGTSGGGAAGSDIKTVDVKTGGVPSEETPVNNSGGGLAPGTTQGGAGGDTTETNTIDPGGLAPGTTLEGKNELAP